MQTTDFDGEASALSRMENVLDTVWPELVRPLQQ
jgi:hypothetical protein